MSGVQRPGAGRRPAGVPGTLAATGNRVDIKTERIRLDMETDAFSTRPPPLGGLTLGSVLHGTYRILRPLAEGGCGEVYVASHTRLSCEVAIKVLHRSLVGDPHAMTRFRQEAAITSSLRHPHIVQIFDFDVTPEGLPFIAMELVDGRPLSASLGLDTPFQPRAVNRIVGEIAEALQAAHDSGVVHRDLKPDNVILASVGDRDDFVKVVDFGISQASWCTRVPGEPVVEGTPEYMSPEQAQGRRGGIDHRADQFSLAAMTYQLLTGRAPFRGDGAMAILYEVVHESPRPASAFAPWLGERLDAVLDRGMAKEPAHRYPSIAAFAEELGRAVEAIGAGAPRPGAASRRPEQGMGAAGPVTRRLIRRVRREIRARQVGSVLFALAVGLAMAWCSPATRELARAAWDRASAEVIGAAEGAPAEDAVQESSRSGAASMP